MTSLHVIENKISSLCKYRTQLATYKFVDQADLDGDATLRGAVERYLYLAAQASIDLAEAAIAYKGFRKPTTNRECFEILVEHKVIDSNLGGRLIKMAAFRNILAHAYERIDYGTIVETLKKSLPDLDEFAQAMKHVN